MDYAKIERDAKRLHDNAKDGILRVGDDVYAIKFDRAQSHYVVSDHNGQVVTRLNTRSIRTAQKWLREWLNN